MKCSKCLTGETKVLESRLGHEGKSVRRRRACQNCEHRFTTYEKEEELTIQVKKKDGRFEEFSREKVVLAISTACRKRSIPLEKIETIVAHIEAKVREKGEREVLSQKIGDIIMEELKKIDKVAYVRFASIYKDFKDAKEFMKELEALD